MKFNKLIKAQKPFHMKGVAGFAVSFILLAFLITLVACEKNDDDDYSADFSFEYLDDNYVQFTNLSQGEYYWMMWDFANGVYDTTADKSKSLEVYFPEAGDFPVSLKVMNYSGSTQTATRTVSIATSNLLVSFTAVIDPDNPNYVTLTNTSQGSVDSFKWLYMTEVVENQMEYLAYFPFAGDFEVELVLTKNGVDYSEKQTITIAADDPNYDPNLIWSEEFNYTGLPDAQKWNMETGAGGWGNNELQYYTNLEANAMVENGVLTITAIEEEYNGSNYTSARITTQNKFDFKYGKIEASIKLPYGQGLWPAFWMLGANINTVGWPSCGEIDIMEMVGGDPNGDNTCYCTLHWDDDGSHASYGDSYTLPSGILADDFHIFTVEWDSQEIRGYIDDIEYYVADLTPAGLSEFHQNFFVILNLAVGGDWPGPPNASTTFPQTMQVDWVRVYQE
jgi:beta-glucanase (GH16 family)